MAPYKVLGACNPRFAHQALQAEARIGTMLPCNVIVRPIASMQAIPNPQLRGIAEQVQGLLKRVVAEV